MKHISKTVGIFALSLVGAVFATTENVVTATVQPNYVTDIAKIAAYLILIIMVILLLSWFLRKFSKLQFSSMGNVKILDSIAVGAREKMLLIEVGETQLLVGVCPGSIRTLHILDKPLEVPQKQVPSIRDLAMKIQTKWRMGHNS